MYLVLNCGSQSIKYKLFDRNLKVIKEDRKSIKNKKEYREFLKEELVKISELGYDIEKISHRIVHGGNGFNKPVIVTKEVLKDLKKFSDFAPLHNPFGIMGIELCMDIFKDKVKEIAVFDNGFYGDMPKEASLYALPQNLIKKYKFKRFGFHGFSHEYVAKEGAKLAGKPLKDLKVITCHLGGGSSITAIKSGKAIDTSMGFTPLEGLVMMTRSGDVDPGIILQLGKDIPFDKLDNILNNSSGVKGMCGYSEMLDVLAEIKKGNEKAKLALDVFIYRVKKYIGSYFTILGGCDLLVFTGTIGFGSAKIRNMVTKDLNILKNTKVLAIETNEELQIIKNTKDL